MGCFKHLATVFSLQPVLLSFRLFLRVCRDSKLLMAHIVLLLVCLETIPNAHSDTFKAEVAIAELLFVQYQISDILRFKLLS